MRHILEGFLGRIASDAALRAFAAGKDVTLRFTLPDLGTTFFLRLRDGAAAAHSAIRTAADVELKMRAEILDGMFTGTRESDAGGDERDASRSAATR